MSKKYPKSQQSTTPVASTDAPVVGRLKAERVQEELTVKVNARLKAERVQERLKRMPGWGLLKGGAGIDRVKDLGTADCAADYAGFVLRKAARDGQVVRVELRGARIILTVPTGVRSGVRSGLSDKQLDFAAAIG